jgi:hypothetical protein
MKWCLGVGLFLFLFVFSSSSFAFDPSGYKPSTIYQEFVRMEADHQEAYKKKSEAKHILVHPMVTFSITAKFTEKDRPLTETNKKGVEYFSKVFGKPKVVEIYIREILVRDSDNREYWLPIQEKFLEPLHKEYYKGCKLTLYLVLAIIIEHEPVAFINEFMVE